MEKTTPTPLEKEKVLEKIKNGEFKNVQTKKPKSVIQKEGAAHHEETEKADKAVKPRPVEEGVPKKTKGKAKPKPGPKTELTFPLEGKVNKYGFLHFSQRLMETLNWEKGIDIPVQITRTERGIAVERA